MNGVLPSDAPQQHPEDPPGDASLPYRRPIFLVGMMGAGKTTIGRGLARELGREFLDLDHEIEHRFGVRVAHTFDVEGEQGFRRRECSVLEECSAQPDLVLATGGGAILAPENRRVLQERGVVIYLRASAEALYSRVARDRSRPLLQTPDPLARIRELLEIREPLYEEVADIIFDTGTMPVIQVVKSLVPLLQKFEVEE